MKTAGIIGGLGPETTAKFYLEIIFSTFEKNKDTRPPILMWSVPIKYQIEDDLFTKAEGEKRYIPYLTDAAKRLENGGADFIVIPCNSVHIFIEEIRKTVKIPVLSILEETAKFLEDKKINRIGLLATKSTVDKKIYQKPLESRGIEVILPIDQDQYQIGRLVKNLVMSKHYGKDKRELIKIIDSFKDRDVENVILACTDLQLLTPKDDKSKIYDSMKILATSTVEKILNK